MTKIDMAAPAAATTQSDAPAVATPPKEIVQEEPQRGGSFVRDPQAGTLTLNEPVPAEQPVKE